jgi:hypothetical protein
MIKLLWILNKYVTGEKGQEFYPTFLKMLQVELMGKDIELHFVGFSDYMEKTLQTQNLFIYNTHAISKEQNFSSIAEAARIEREYKFTFKQAWFPDILQVSKKQNNRMISVPSNELNDLNPLVDKFLFLERLIKENKYDFLFSDVSPEVEMEFGRAIGLKMGITVLKSYEGSFLGRSVILKNEKFGKYSLVESLIEPHSSKKDTQKYIDDYKKYKKQPSYVGIEKNTVNQPLIQRVSHHWKSSKSSIPIKAKSFVGKLIKNMLLTLESSVVKRKIYSAFTPNTPYLFFGFHLNDESTMGLRSQPFVNQVSLVEMLSRVLPYGYTLYVREHPHWPKHFSYTYLEKCTHFPNVKLLSPKISIHDILENAKAVLVYNSNTGIEALLYGKPVLSFSSNIYYNLHRAVLYCDDLFKLGELLSELINTEVDQQDTVNYVQRMLKSSFPMLLGSETFISEHDSLAKAKIFANVLELSIRSAHNMLGE